MPEADPFKAYIPHTEAEIASMLAAIGEESIDGLYRDVPQNILNPDLDLPSPMLEPELMVYMGRLAKRNLTGVPSFLGFGAYRHFAPSIVDRIILRDEFETSYTPYQAEISQGTLQTTFDFQSMMCILTGMDISNTGMLDEATALAEAGLMAARQTGRNILVVSDTVHPHSRNVISNFTRGKGLTVETVDLEKGIALDKNTAALVVQYPNYLGCIEDLRILTDLAHKNDSLMVVSVDNPTSLGILKPPGSFGSDIVVGNGQGLGLPLDTGGANVGIFTAKKGYLRQMPGRIVGRTKDLEGKTGFVLTQQPREQHIRREKATSNICTAEALMALAVTIYLADHGKRGFQDLAKLNATLAHNLAERISEIPGYRLPLERPFFNEFVVECPKSPSDINRALLHPEREEDKIIGGVDVSNKVPNGMLICVTETTTEEDMDRFVTALARAA